MSFFGGNRGNTGAQSVVQTTHGGVPVDAISRLRRMRGEGGKPLFTSDLSVSEFVLLKELGMEPLGLVLGSSIYHVGIQYANYYANSELGVLTQAMYQARELAMARMEEEAATLGADGIVGVRLEVGGYAWAANALEFTAIGTAVGAPQGNDYRTPHGKPFTSDLSVQDFYKLHEAGYIPAELVLGTCVYHIAHQGFMQSMRTLGNNIELPNYTEAIYDARELAMSRMQAEAESHAAEGVVGMQIVEKNHIWQPHIIEFLAIGTSIIKRAQSKGVRPQFQIGLND
ncbi:MAG: heavy metal-binding domain-containing protein [Candidatus Eremiobacteraeota bacterium]|nr:heavy metal-binding domain-containing protein [Candidatus Eremiobacteraeota bacterium]MBC5802580.1 heavy metal-binding domain-containing protein [Candidatus Eremiobacteraeota bacterium]MBC5822174.1 heavy metal-binding domain-containing protein [Candidatus Eremiobacteraeota bacterium]